jgi:hypothetical protein
LILQEVGRSMEEISLEHFVIFLYFNGILVHKYNAIHTRYSCGGDLKCAFISYVCISYFIFSFHLQPNASMPLFQ